MYITVTIYKPGVEWPNGIEAELRTIKGEQALVGTKHGDTYYKPESLPVGTEIQIRYGWTAEKEAALTAWMGQPMEEPAEICDGGGYEYHWFVRG